jgi:adenylyl-sulfate kinase
VTSGIIRKDDEIRVLPSGKRSKVTSIITYDGEVDYAYPPQSVTVTLEDEIDISRGDMIVHTDNLPKIERHFEAMLVWMDEKPMSSETQFYLKHTTNTTKARIDTIRYKIDVNTLEKSGIEWFTLNDIGRVVITSHKPLFFDPYKKNHGTGAFVLIDPVSNNTCAVGMIIDQLKDQDLPSRITDMDLNKIERGESLISKEEREKFYDQKGATIWITGLHGSGKNHLAYILEKRLFDEGATVVLLDGSTVRSGLSKELDYSPADRTEHLRRVAHVARLLNEQGIITICSFISPDENIRQQVAEIIGKERFHLIYMDADLNFCRNNKPLLYEKFDAGAIENMPGLDIEFEIPKSPKLILIPQENDRNSDVILDYLAKEKIFPIK